MNQIIKLIAVVATLTGLSSCKDDEPKLDPVTASLVSSLNEELKPLPQDPLKWSDNELKFLDAFGDHAIVGLGEATHGTSEFFKAKHRMFRYLVEKHGFKIFAIEADFGESLLINQAVLTSDKNKIVGLMNEKMHFWTWKTNEVRDLLFWMCDYNINKPEGEKVQYWGVDCQYNTFHSDMATEQLQAAQVSFFSFAEVLLKESKTAASSRFAGYTQTMYDTYAGKLDALTDSLTKYKDYIVSKGSEKQYQRTLQLVRVTKQVSDVAYYFGKQTSSNYRDGYMADNTVWLKEYFNDAKIVLWAHNFHVADYLAGGTTGYHLKEDFPYDYGSVGFLFSKGTFRAVTVVNNQSQGVNAQSLQADPKEGSINDVMSRAEEQVFTVKISDLQRHDEWNTTSTKGIEFFQMGAAYNNNPGDYYGKFDINFHDQLIYFNTTTSAVPVQQ